MPRGLGTYGSKRGRPPKKSKPKPKPVYAELRTDLATVVAWIKKNAKVTDKMSDLKEQAAKAGIKLYPRAWGAAFQKRAGRKEVYARSAAVAAIRRKPSASSKAYTTVVIEGKDSLHIEFNLNNPQVSFNGKTLTVTEQ